MKNEKGFTLIEVITVVIILGVLTTVSTVSVYKYVKKSRKADYDNMEKTMYSAARNYILDKGMEFEIGNSGTEGLELTAEELMKSDYVEELKDPKNKSRNCSGFVKVRIPADENVGSTGDIEALDSYEYLISIACTNYTRCAHFDDKGSLITHKTDNPIINDGEIKGTCKWNSWG